MLSIVITTNHVNAFIRNRNDETGAHRGSMILQRSPLLRLYQSPWALLVAKQNLVLNLEQ